MKEKFLEVKNIGYKIGEKNIINDISFSLQKGEVLSILGPSGSGKSTILRTIAGLIKPSTGSIKLINNILSSDNAFISTGKREIGLMFQEDVLFPHYTVYQNIEFGIKSKNKQVKKETVKNILKTFKLSQIGDLYPEKISGGEKQRVALARILITKPKVLLMDEPFSSLDFNLRKEISNYTIKLLKNSNISVIFVTHDVKSAFKVSDRMLIVNEGKILQNDIPMNIYNRPDSKFIAEFIGETNEIEANINKKGEIFTPFGRVKCLSNQTNIKDCNKKHYCLIRPKDIIISDNGISCKVLEKEFLGSNWEYTVLIDKNTPVMKIKSDKSNIEKNKFIKLKIDTNKILVFTK